MEWINDIILGLTEMYGTNDVYDLLDCLNIIIIKLDKENILLNHNDAFYYRNYFGNEVIFIRNDLPLNYEKFVLAHELSHAIIHINAETAAFSLVNSGKLEQQANYFAFKLSNIKFDEIELTQMSVEQIASWLELPCEPLKQLVNISI